MSEWATEAVSAIEKLFRTPVSVVFVSLVAGVVRTIFSTERRTLRGYCRGLFLAIFVAFLVSNLMSEYDFGDGTKTFTIAIAAFSADDILYALLKLTKTLRDDPLKFIKNVANLIRGKE